MVPENWVITEPITSATIDLQKINKNRNHNINELGEKLVLNLLGVTSLDWCSDSVACDSKNSESIGLLNDAKFYMEG